MTVQTGSAPLYVLCGVRMQLYVSSKRQRIYPHFFYQPQVSTTPVYSHRSLSSPTPNTPRTIKDRVAATPPFVRSVVRISEFKDDLLRMLLRLCRIFIGLFSVHRSDSFLTATTAKGDHQSKCFIFYRDVNTSLIDLHQVQRSMQCPSSHLAGMGMYDPVNHAAMWSESFKGDDLMNTCPSTALEVIIKFDNPSEGTSNGTSGYANHFDEEIAKPADKVQRRLAQNREAARKCRLRKKGYVQHLETSRLKLKQLEQELDRTRQPGLVAGGGLVASNIGYPGAVNSGIPAFEVEYGYWVEKNSKQVIELRNALNAHQSDLQLQTLVDNSMKHYCELFQMKATAAKADVFYLMSGMWKTTTERFFLWIGGFRPSELLKILMPQLHPLAETQLREICNLRRSCQQAEDALSQGIDKLQEIVVVTLAGGQVEDGSCVPQIAATMDKMGDLVSFVHQADHLRHETLNQMTEILTTHQTAKWLLALGDYLERLRTLSSLWAKRPMEDA